MVDLEDLSPTEKLVFNILRYRKEPMTPEEVAQEAYLNLGITKGSLRMLNKHDVISLHKEKNQEIVVIRDRA